MFNTSFESIELLRAKMQDFLEVERRDFLPNIAINVNDYAGQTRTTLSAGISYRSNWQDGGLKVARESSVQIALLFPPSAHTPLYRTEQMDLCLEVRHV
jgi:hypothetical protein